jgi:hypothetical protein
VALRAEVTAVRRVPVVTLDAAADAGESLADPPSNDDPDRSDRGVNEVLRRIDAVTAAAVEATSSAARRSSPAAKHSGRW